jgi:uncharacterized protein with von Willebrand factor type A (vWA) domain
LGYATDYANVFKQFSHEKVFNKKTVLIIFGDAENTANTSGDGFLKLISEQCKAVYWLDPQDPKNWGKTELDSYKKYCREVYECSTLRHLESFTQKLVRI